MSVGAAWASLPYRALPFTHSGEPERRTHPKALQPAVVYPIGASVKAQVIDWILRAWPEWAELIALVPSEDDEE